MLKHKVLKCLQLTFIPGLERLKLKALSALLEDMSLSPSPTYQFVVSRGSSAYLLGHSHDKDHSFRTMGSWQNLFLCASISELAKPSSLVQVWMLMCVKSSCCCFVLPVSQSLRPCFCLQRPASPVPVLSMVNKHAETQVAVIVGMDKCLSSLSCHPSQDSMWVTAGSPNILLLQFQGIFCLL